MEWEIFSLGKCISSQLHDASQLYSVLIRRQQIDLLTASIDCITDFSNHKDKLAVFKNYSSSEFVSRSTALW